MFRKLTKKEFNQFKKLFFILTILLAVYFIFFTRTMLSEFFAFAGFIISCSTFMLFKRHEWYDNEYEEEK